MSRGINTEGENYELLYQRVMRERGHMQNRIIELQKGVLQLEQNRIQVGSIFVLQFEINLWYFNDSVTR